MAGRKKGFIFNLTEAEKKDRAENAKIKKQKYRAGGFSVDIRGCTERWNVCKITNNFATHRETADFLLCRWENSSDNTVQNSYADLIGKDVSGKKNVFCSSDAAKMFQNIVTNLQPCDLNQFRCQVLEFLDSYILNGSGTLQPTGEYRAAEKNRFTDICDVELVNVEVKEGDEPSDSQRVEITLSGVLMRPAGTEGGIMVDKVLAEETNTLRSTFAVSTVKIEEDVKDDIKQEDVAAYDPLNTNIKCTLETSETSGMGTRSGVTSETYVDSLVSCARIADTCDDDSGTGDQSNRQTGDQAKDVTTRDGLCYESSSPNKGKRKPTTDCDSGYNPDNCRVFYSKDDLTTEVSSPSEKKRKLSSQKKKAKKYHNKDGLPDDDSSDPEVDSEEESQESNKKKQKGSCRSVKSPTPEVLHRHQEIRCNECASIFPSQALLKKHKKEAHVETYECSVCRQKLPTRWFLTKHEAEHTGKFILCQHCGKRLYSQSALKVHIASKHSLERHKCDLCPKAFVGRHSLYFHVKMCHSGQVPEYLCATCGKSFSKKGYLARHNLTHTGIRKFHCKLCGAAFNQKSNLMVHMRSHERNHEYLKKWFSCSVCGLKCGNKRGLTTHMKSHD